MRRTVIWPRHWTRTRVSPGVWLAEKHTLRRATPAAGAWAVRCPQERGRVVGEAELLDDAVDVLHRHLFTCMPAAGRPAAESETGHGPAACVQALRDGYRAVCEHPDADHCAACRHCPGHHAPGCRDGHPLTIQRIAGRVRPTGHPPVRMVTVRLPDRTPA
ncbi:hypothetical protein [Saccharothrix xinjiangensis]|uniref:Uncharacterized protein n=1 Tax=Saccharothrix xinjiangensis TaxID=204798 RepID=A0ABV9XTG1_9PSEU